MDEIERLVLDSVRKWGGPKKTKTLLAAMRGLKQRADAEGQGVYQNYFRSVSNNPAGSQQALALMMMGSAFALMVCEKNKRDAQKN